jgi:DNA-binding transcriptional MerR regulator
VSLPTRDPQHLSIGEVLSSLHDEFPDVTVSKIRFLESQGLIDPERTPSGYRRFYTADVERLRWILVQQRDHFLPLRVIKERLDHYGPQGAPPLTNGDQPTKAATPATRAPAPSAPKPARPARRVSTSALTLPLEAVSEPAPTNLVAPPVPVEEHGHTREELCKAAGLGPGALEELESYGLVAPTSGVGEHARYDDDALEIARVASTFYRHAVRARHLRMYQHFAEREAELFIQALILYRRQRNPAARARLEGDLSDLGQAGARLRALMLRRALLDAWQE